MGIEYYLLKPDKEEVYELGKSSWNLVFRDFCDKTINANYFVKPNRHDVYFNILKYVAMNFNEETKLKYFRKLADNITEWCNGDKIIVIDDMNFDGNIQKTFKQTSSRYEV